MGYLFVLLTVFEVCERGKLLIIISFLLTINHQSLIITRNSKGVETCNYHTFALSNAREFSFSQVHTVKPR